MKTTYIVRESDSMVFSREGEIFLAETLTAAKCRASRMQFYQGTNLRLEYENGAIVSTKRNGAKWVDDL